jgi:hypothetical protein
LATELRPWHILVLTLTGLMLIVSLVGIGSASMEFLGQDQREAGGQPVPEDVFLEARSLLNKGDTWKVVLDGTAVYCADFSEAPFQDRRWTHYWLRFRLAPAVPGCDDVDVTIENRNGTWEVRQ